ncbi:MAG: cupredoxin domain-containing protein [Longimicrobiales bacterium]
MQDRLRAMMGFGAVALLTGAIAAACSSDTTEPPPGNNEENEILMLTNTFSPDDITIDVGETVTWRNNEAIPHTITSEDDEWPNQNVPAEEGWDFTHEFEEAGTYDYECQVHNGMVGTIEVVE